MASAKLGLERDGLNTYSKFSLLRWGNGGQQTSALPGCHSKWFSLNLSINPEGLSSSHSCASGPRLPSDPKSPVDWEVEKGSPTTMANLPTLFHWKWGNRREELQQNTGLRTAYVDVRFPWSDGSPGCHNSKKTEKKNLVSSLQDDEETKVRYERKREESPVKMSQIDLRSCKPQNERIFHERQILPASCPIVQTITECLLCPRRCVISWGYEEEQGLAGIRRDALGSRVTPTLRFWKQRETAHLTPPFFLSFLLSLCFSGSACLCISLFPS